MATASHSARLHLAESCGIIWAFAALKGFEERISHLMISKEKGCWETGGAVIPGWVSLFSFLLSDHGWSSPLRFRVNWNKYMPAYFWRTPFQRKTGGNPLRQFWWQNWISNHSHSSWLPTNQFVEFENIVSTIQAVWVFAWRYKLGFLSLTKKTISGYVWRVG